MYPCKCDPFQDLFPQYIYSIFRKKRALVVFLFLYALLLCLTGQDETQNVDTIHSNLIQDIYPRILFGFP